MPRIGTRRGTYSYSTSTKIRKRDHRFERLRGASLKEHLHHLGMGQRGAPSITSKQPFSITRKDLTRPEFFRANTETRLHTSRVRVPQITVWKALLIIASLFQLAEASTAEASWRDDYPECYAVDKLGLYGSRKRFFLSSGQEISTIPSARSGNAYILDSPLDPTKVEMVYMHEIGAFSDGPYAFVSNDLASDGLSSRDFKQGKDQRISGRKSLDSLAYKVQWIRKGGVHIHPDSECIIAAKEDKVSSRRLDANTLIYDQKYPDQSLKTVTFENLHVDCAWVSVVDHVEVMKNLFLRARGSTQIDTRPCYAENVMRKRLISKPGDLLLYEDVAFRVHGSAVVIVNETINLLAGARFQVIGPAALFTKDDLEFDPELKCGTSEYHARENAVQTLYTNARKMSGAALDLPKGIAFRCREEKWVFRNIEYPSRIISRKKTPPNLNSKTVEKVSVEFTVPRKGVVPHWREGYSKMCSSMSDAHFWGYFNKCTHGRAMEIVTCMANDLMTDGHWISQESGNHVGYFFHEIPGHLQKQMHLGDQVNNPEAQKHWEVKIIPNKDGPPYIYRDKDCIIRLPEEAYPDVSRTTNFNNRRGTTNTHITYGMDSLQTLSGDGDFVVECARVAVLSHLQFKGSVFIRATGDVPLQSHSCYKDYRFHKNLFTGSGDVIFHEGVRADAGKNFFVIAQRNSILGNNVNIHAGGSFVEIANGMLSKGEQAQVFTGGGQNIASLIDAYEGFKAYSDTVPVGMSHNFIRGGEAGAATGYVTTPLPSQLNFDRVTEQWGLLESPIVRNAVVSKESSELVPIWEEWPNLHEATIGAMFVAGEGISHYAAHVHSIASNIFFVKQGEVSLASAVKRRTWTTGCGFFSSCKTHWKDDHYPSTIQGDRTYLLLPQGDFHAEGSHVNSQTLVVASAALLRGKAVEQGRIKERLFSTEQHMLRTVEPTKFNGGALFILNHIFDAKSMQVNGEYFIVRAKDRFQWDTMTCSYDASYEGLVPFMQVGLPFGAVSVTVTPEQIQARAQLPFQETVGAIVAKENDALARVLSAHALVTQGAEVANLINGKASFFSVGLRYTKTHTHAEWPSQELNVVQTVSIVSPEVIFSGGVNLLASKLNIHTDLLEKRAQPASVETRTKSASISVNELGQITGTYAQGKVSKRESVLPVLQADQLHIDAEKAIVTNYHPATHKSRHFSVDTAGQIGYSSSGTGRERNYVISGAALIDDVASAFNPKKDVKPHFVGKTCEPYAYTPIPDGALSADHWPTHSDSSLLDHLVDGMSEGFGDQLKSLPRQFVGLKLRDVSLTSNLEEIRNGLLAELSAWWESVDMKKLIQKAKEPEGVRKIGYFLGSLGGKKSVALPKAVRKFGKPLKLARETGYEKGGETSQHFFTGWDQGIDKCIQKLQTSAALGHTKIFNQAALRSDQSAWDQSAAFINRLKTSTSEERAKEIGEKSGYVVCQAALVAVSARAGKVAGTALVAALK